MSERAAPHYCPYCGEEDLFPSASSAESSEASHRAWECACCNRAFTVSFLGLLAKGLRRRQPDHQGEGTP